MGNVQNCDSYIPIKLFVRIILFVEDFSTSDVIQRGMILR
jgi:hypothetical protein